MPIYHKTPSSIVGNNNTAEIDYHTSEAAKVKRTREQAYFNSYDFDAIEVLPYDEDNDDEEPAEGVERNNRRVREATQNPQISKSHNKQFQITQQHLKQHPTHSHNKFIAGNSSKDSFMVNNLQQQQHVNHKYNPSLYLQRLSGLFSNKTSSSNNNTNNNLQHHPHHQHQHNNNNSHASAAACVVDIASMDKHLKLSSSETSSTSLSSSSVVEEVLTDSCSRSSSNAGGGGGHRDVVSESVGVVVVDDNDDGGGSISVTMDKMVNTKGGTGNCGNFLLPRAMLKYQSSTSVVVAAAASVAATAAPSNLTANLNSMPLATAACNNTITPKQTKPQQQQQLTLTRDVNRIEGNGKGNVATMLTAGKSVGVADGGHLTELRLKKNSVATSIATSLNSEDLSLTKPVDNVVLPQNKAMEERKVLPKTINPKSSARALSHQSHYSTDKSASSGYYSSNVCSTYSLEEPIYSEPTIDIKDIRKDTKESNNKPPTLASSVTPAKALHTAANQLKPASMLQPPANEMDSVMRALDFNRRYRLADNDTGIDKQIQTLPSPRNSLEFSENLKILESSIENLDRHLKSFPQLASSDAMVAYGQNPYSSYSTVNHNDKMRSSSSYNHLPTIQEGFEKAKNPIWIEERSDDSLMDIDLDSFLLDKDKKLNKRSSTVLADTKGIDNPSFLTDEQEENHYKCAKYINSCPEDAYRVESDILAPTRSSISEQSVAVSGELYPKHYVEQLHFQNTRELLEDVRDKIRHLTLTQASSDLAVTSAPNDKEPAAIPKELNSMIGTLKQELELYLERMNHNSDLEIRQLCTGLVKNQNIVKMKNAFERRRSLTDSNDICSTYEAVHDGLVMSNPAAGPIKITQQITSIRCTSDPNFKMKRKSITEVFPMAECYIETIETDPNDLPGHVLIPMATQLQRNLQYHKPILEQLHAQLSQKPENHLISSHPQAIVSSSSGDTSETNDKESILDWHRKKPSIWEMYYGTNRIQQALLGSKKNGAMVTTTTIASSPSTMCYPSSRPESDFTLDLPRAEQLRIKMEKEKKFRHRCRVITTFLSLVFFLLTVMVVSLVLTRGKRMFGSMI